MSTTFRIFAAIPILMCSGRSPGILAVALREWEGTAVVAGAGDLLFFGPLLMIPLRQKYPRW